MECKQCGKEAGDVPRWQGEVFCNPECRYWYVKAAVAELKRSRRPTKPEKQEFLSESAKRYIKQKGKK